MAGMMSEATQLGPSESTAGELTAMIFTDGACIGNPGPGGYAALVRVGDSEHVLTGGESVTTNNRMELMAAIKALQYLPAGAPAVVHSDSEYVVKGASEWLSSWKARDWRKADRKPVSNRGLWETIDGLCQSRNVKWLWVRGHAGHPENERVDGLASAEAKEQQRLLELVETAEQ